MAKLLNDKHNVILEFIKANPSLSSKEISDGIDAGFGYASVKRTLQKLIAEKLIIATGTRKGTKYQLGINRVRHNFRYFFKKWSLAPISN